MEKLKLAIQVFINCCASGILSGLFFFIFGYHSSDYIIGIYWIPGLVFGYLFALPFFNFRFTIFFAVLSAVIYFVVSNIFILIAIILIPNQGIFASIVCGSFGGLLLVIAFRGLKRNPLCHYSLFIIVISGGIFGFFWFYAINYFDYQIDPSIPKNIEQLFHPILAFLCWQIVIGLALTLTLNPGESVTQPRVNIKKIEGILVSIEKNTLYRFLAMVATILSVVSLLK